MLFVHSFYLLLFLFKFTDKYLISLYYKNKNHLFQS